MVPPMTDLPTWADTDPHEYAIAQARQRLAEAPPDADPATLPPDRIEGRLAREGDGARADPAYQPDTSADVERRAAILAAIAENRPAVILERIGPSYRASVGEAVLTFREVRVDRDLSADVTITHRGRHLFRTGSTLSLTGRDKLAKTAAEFSRSDNGTPWRAMVFAAVEAVLAEEEGLGGLVDLRTAADSADGPTDVLRPIMPNASSVLTMPGEGGKSTLARAMAVSVATGREIIPGVVPMVTGPALIIAGEDPAVVWHARSIEAICRGVGLDRSTIDRQISLLDARGRPLHRIARSIAERAADHALVILDSLQTLLATADANGGIRDRDGLFWNAVDTIERPVFILAHPNRADSQRWQAADGRIAGSEVNRDRARMAWRGVWTDEKAVAGTSFRRYTLTCVKRNNGPRPEPVSFAAAWEFGLGNDPGTVRFLPSEAVTRAPDEDRLPTKNDQATVDAYRDGHRTPSQMANALGINAEAAKKRLQRVREAGYLRLLEDPT
jgi:AAA domain